MPKIFTVEDNDDIREMVIYALSSAGFEVEGFADGGAFYAALRTAAPSLVLLDIMMPDEDGIAILKHLRQSAKFAKIPVIMLTAKVTELDRVRGLDLGADDYITKPFSVMELVSRVRAVLRRYDSGENRTVTRVGDVTLDREKRTVTADGAEVTLTYKEFELLGYLMANVGIVLSRDTLLDRVWGFDYGGESRTVDMHVKSLRQKLGASGEMIKTVRNVGYKAGE
jgi:two-component system alkaline phosphatase synthesis response regulator PhoP